MPQLGVNHSECVGHTLYSVCVHPETLSPSRSEALALDVQPSEALYT